jgi:hypothetical protein
VPHPDEPTLPDDAWRPLPAEFARAARPALADSHAAVLVLLDRTGEMLAAVGPFANQAAAGRWRPTPDLATRCNAMRCE